MHPSMLEHEEPILLMPGLFIAAISLAAWIGRKGFAYSRPFGSRDRESLMNCSPMGSLHCQCDPTDAASKPDDRRQSCRECGSLIVDSDPAGLYALFTPSQIRVLTEGVRRRAIDEARSVSRVRLGQYADASSKSPVA